MGTTCSAILCNRSVTSIYWILADHNTQITANDLHSFIRSFGGLVQIRQKSFCNECLEFIVKTGTTSPSKPQITVHSCLSTDYDLSIFLNMKLSISQLIVFRTVKRGRAGASSSIYHCRQRCTTWIQTTYLAYKFTNGKSDILFFTTPRIRTVSPSIFPRQNKFNFCFLSFHYFTVCSFYFTTSVCLHL